MTKPLEFLQNAGRTLTSMWSAYVEPLLDEASRYTGIPVLLLSTILLVVSYRIAGRIARTATQLTLGVAIALGAAYVRGALVH